MTTQFPLEWPDGWPVTAPRDRLWSLPGGSAQGWDRVCERLFSEMERLGASGVVLSTDQPLRQDGKPYAARRIIEEPGAAMYFTLHGRQMVMAQDRYERLVDNIRSLALAIEGMRQMQRHGGDHMMERAFSGFEALPPPGAGNAPHWSTLLGCDRKASLQDIESAFREKAKLFHPDRPGGSTVKMAELNAAYSQAKIERQHDRD